MALMLAIDMSRCERGMTSGGAGSGGGSDSISEFMRDGNTFKLDWLRELMERAWIVCGMNENDKMFWT